MRASTDDSVKLNKDLERYIERALEEGRPIKIGWGQAGDEKPKEGEFGVISHLPEGARVQCLGNLGEYSGSANLGGTFTLIGNASTMFAAYHSSGRTVVEKNTGNMKGGLVMVMGSVGSNPGLGMSDGRIIVSGSCPPPGEGVSMRAITKSEIKELSEKIDPLGMVLTEDALVLEPTNEGESEGNRPESFISEGFEKISLVPNEDALHDHITLDHFTLLVPSNSDAEGLALPIPWIVKKDDPSLWEEGSMQNYPSLVRSKPRKVDMMLVDEGNLLRATSEIGDSAGLVLDTEAFRGFNDAEIEGVLVSLVSRLEGPALVLLKGGIVRVERLFRLVSELEVDGAIVDCASPGGTRMPAALPKIGLAMKAMKMREMGKFVFLEVDEQPEAKDLLISLASGCNGIVSPASENPPESQIENISLQLAGWMREIGIDRIERIGRRNLCAKDYDTAAISGLRLNGYDRPLPMWLELG